MTKKAMIYAGLAVAAVLAFMWWKKKKKAAAGGPPGGLVGGMYDTGGVA